MKLRAKLRAERDAALAEAERLRKALAAHVCPAVTVTNWQPTMGAAGCPGGWLTVPGNYSQQFQITAGGVNAGAAGPAPGYYFNWP
jgi:hypothetical protein